jgi:hypothetical protein
MSTASSSIQKYLTWEYIVPAALIVVAICLICGKSRENFDATFIPAQPWIQYPEYPAPFRGDRLYLGGSTKCFSCEKDAIKRGLPTYLAHPTKCFSCDAQAAYNYGSWAGQFGQSNKCFSCESQYANNPFKTNPKVGATPYCQPQSCGTQNYVSRYGRADGQSYDDHLNNDGVGLTTGFGRVDGMGGTYVEGAPQSIEN